METTATTNKTSRGRKNAIGGFYVGRLDGDIMRAYIEENELEVDVEDVTDEQIAVGLTTHFKDNVPEDDWVSCDECGGISGADETQCPYCGDSSAVEDKQGASTKAAVEEEEEADDDAEEEKEEDDEDETEEEEEDDEEPEVQAAPTAAKTKKKGTGNMVTEEQTTNGQKVVHVKGRGGAMTAKDLDKAIAEVEKLKGAAAEDYWELGKKILEINVKQLWKLRMKDDGKTQKYKGFDAFVAHELNMSPGHAYEYINCAKNYETAEEVRELGKSKATLILKAAPADRKKLKAKAKAGATAKQLRSEVKKSREKHGSPKADVDHRSKAGTKGAKATAALKAEKISIANIEGSKTIKLYVRPDSMRGLDFSKLKRATKLSDTPFGRFEMANGVAQYFSVLLKDGELVLKIETRREAAEE